MISQCFALHLHHPTQQLLYYPFHLGKEIICALINYVSKLITDSHSEDLFSGTNPCFIYWISQIPGGKAMLHLKGIFKESLMKGHVQECGQRYVKPIRNSEAPG